MDETLLWAALHRPTQRSVRSQYRLQILRGGRFETETSYRSQRATAMKQLQALRVRGRIARVVNANGEPIAHNTDIHVSTMENVV